MKRKMLKDPIMIPVKIESKDWNGIIREASAIEDRTPSSWVRHIILREARKILRKADAE